MDFSITVMIEQNTKLQKKKLKKCSCIDRRICLGSGCYLTQIRQISDLDGQTISMNIVETTESFS